MEAARRCFARRQRESAARHAHRPPGRQGPAHRREALRRETLMAIETIDSFHAAATVAVDNNGTPNFVHSANQGFAAFGTEPDKNSLRIGPGRFRLRLVSPVNLL